MSRVIFAISRKQTQISRNKECLDNSAIVYRILVASPWRNEEKVGSNERDSTLPPTRIDADDNNNSITRQVRASFILDSPERTVSSDAPVNKSRNSFHRRAIRRFALKEVPSRPARSSSAWKRSIFRGAINRQFGQLSRVTFAERNSPNLIT